MKQNVTRIEKMKKNAERYQIPCYFSDSVKIELKQKIEGTINYVGNIIRNFLRESLERGKTNRGLPISSPITSEDIIELEKAFVLLHGSIRAMSYLTQPIEIIEEWVINFLEEKMETGSKIDIDHFIIELAMNILDITSKIQNPYDEIAILERSYMKSIQIVADISIENNLRSIGIHDPDTTHIACALNNQLINNQKTIFVTLDYNSIISKQDEIKKTVNISCCDPLYAIHHLIT